MKIFLQRLTTKPQGMAMIIVLIVSFIVLATIGTGASIIANNLNKAGGQAAKARAEVSASVAFEKLKALFKAKPNLLQSCSGGTDCLKFTGLSADQSCVSCSDPAAIYTAGDVKYKIKINELIPPSAGNGDPNSFITGSAVFSLTGYYKNISQQKISNVCLDYCAPEYGNYECGPNGCGGSCGDCPDDRPICSTAQKCESTEATCSNVGIECDDSCGTGAQCGGGTLIDIEQGVIVSSPNCNSEPCETDDFIAPWDNQDDYADTGAYDTKDGRNNKEHLVIDERYVAANSCFNANYNGFNDWYLPAKDEFEIMFRSSEEGSSTGYSENDCYWSSTEDNRTDVFVGGFRGQYENCRDRSQEKNKELYVRCLRRWR